MRRFQEHERRGRRPILLYCGDHDPVGLQIPESLPGHFAKLEKAVGWSPENLTIERFGLKADFIEEHDLIWIDGLLTSSGKDLGDPRHKHHRHDHVQRYIRQFGKRKVEANALVVRPDAGRQLCRDAIVKRLDLDAIAGYEQKLAEKRRRCGRHSRPRPRLCSKGWRLAFRREDGDEEFPQPQRHRGGRSHNE